MLHVHGTPSPQGSKTAYIRHGRAIVTEGGSQAGRASHAAWRQAVATAARDWQQANDQKLLDEPVRLSVVFYLLKPRSVPKYKQHPTTKPDLDKLIRAVLDSLTGILLRDDSLVVMIAAEKTYGDPPGAVISITPMGQEKRS
jgi:Holliday junction resolvase RusA-like endonuclease